MGLGHSRGVRDGHQGSTAAEEKEEEPLRHPLSGGGLREGKRGL